MTNEDHKYDDVLNMVHGSKAAACLAEQVQNEYKDSYGAQSRHLSSPPRRAIRYPRSESHKCTDKLFSRVWLRKIKSIRFL